MVIKLLNIIYSNETNEFESFELPPVEELLFAYEYNSTCFTKKLYKDSIQKYRKIKLFLEGHSIIQKNVKESIETRDILKNDIVKMAKRIEDIKAELSFKREVIRSTNFEKNSKILIRSTNATSEYDARFAKRR